jgi:putative oxidoreductase
MPSENALTAWSPYPLAALRIMSALLLMAHGTMKLFAFPAAMPMEINLVSLMGLAGILEVFGGALLAVGLFTRPVAFVLSGFMAVAYFMAHAPQSFYPVLNQGDAAILFCFVFFYLVFAGAGAFSLDALRQGRAGGLAASTR